MSPDKRQHVYVIECGAHVGIEMFEQDGHAAACSLIGGWRRVRLFEVASFSRIVYRTSFSLEALHSCLSRSSRFKENTCHRAPICKWPVAIAIANCAFSR